MTRKKVKLAFITNDSARKATFKKRKKGLMKKVSELSTLCGVDACAIIYSPYDTQPEVWPNAMGVQRVLSQFKRMPEMEQSKKMVNQETFIRQRIAKANEQLKKQHKDNREKEITEVMFQCLASGKGLQNLMIADLNDLGWLLDHNLKEIYKRIESLKKMGPSQAVPTPPATAAPPSVPVPTATTTTTTTTGGCSTSELLLARGGVHAQEEKPAVDLRQQWFTDWMNNPNEQIGFGHGDEMMIPFADNHASMWPNVFFP